MSNLGYIQMSLKDPLLAVSLFCHLASIILCALILSETLALYKSFTYLLKPHNTPLVARYHKLWEQHITSWNAVYRKNWAALVRAKTNIRDLSMINQTVTASLATFIMSAAAATGWLWHWLTRQTHSVDYYRLIVIDMIIIIIIKKFIRCPMSVNWIWSGLSVYCIMRQPYIVYELF